MIRVTIVSLDHTARAGLRDMLANQPGIRVTGEAVDLESVNENGSEVAVLALLSLPCGWMNATILPSCS